MLAHTLLSQNPPIRLPGRPPPPGTAGKTTIVLFPFLSQVRGETPPPRQTPQGAASFRRKSLKPPPLPETPAARNFFLFIILFFPEKINPCNVFFPKTAFINVNFLQPLFLCAFFPPLCAFSSPLFLLCPFFSLLQAASPPAQKIPATISSKTPFPLRNAPVSAVTPFPAITSALKKKGALFSGRRRNAQTPSAHAKK